MKQLLLTLTILASTLACTQKNQVLTINGTVVDTTLNGKKAFLGNYSNEQIIDSCLIADSKFTFTVNTDSLAILRVETGEIYANVLVEKGVVNVTMDRPSVISGTTLNEANTAYETHAKELYKKMWEEPSEKLREQKASQDSLQNLWNTYRAAEQEWEEKNFSANQTNVFGLKLLWDKLVQEQYSVVQIDSLINLNGSLAQNFGMIQRTREAAVNRENTSQGKMFVDFEAVTLDGSATKLSDYVGNGKYVLVDFWASWCGPCRAEIPVINEVYQTYKDKGLIVLSVNVWDSKKECEKSIIDLGMNWNHIACFDNQAPTDTYGINGIPHIILFAPDGTIEARELRGDELKETVAKVMTK
ncbi:MAG: TlpA disulfide reductase family protein [Mucinivorans sp.]